MTSRFPAGNFGTGGNKENGSTKDNGNGKDSVFDLDSAAFASDQFRMNEFKVKRCPRARPHDWTQCPFAHPGEKARRRDPRRYKYSGTACPEFRKSGCCRRGDACPFAHGVFECWLHPSRYRTQLCTDGTNCKRRVCFFAHVESELRHPEDDPGVAEKQVQAELAAEVQTLQQQHLTQALQALLMQTTNPMSSAERHSQFPALSLEVLNQNVDMQQNEMMSDVSSDNGNSTAALQHVLLQHLAAKEQQLQRMSDKTGEMQTSAPEVDMDGATSNHMQHQPDVYDTLSQLKALSASVNSPMVSSAPAVGPAFDSNAFLSQLMASGGQFNGMDLHSNPLLISHLLQQNSLKVGSNGQVRRSIDNSYLTSLLSEAPHQMVQASSPYQSTSFQNGGFLSRGTNGVTSDNQPQLPVASSGTFPPSSSGDTSSMYSIENIQRLLQNPAFSSNLSQLFQMNPALIQQLSSNQVDSANPGRHSIDNAYLTRLNGDMGRLVSNGGIPSIGSGNHVNHPHVLMMNGYSNGAQTSADPDKIWNDSLIPDLHSLKLSLGNGSNSVTSVPTDRQGNPEVYSHAFIPHSSPESNIITSEGPSSNGNQGQSDGLNN